MLQYELQQVLCKRVRGIVASLLSSNKRQLVAILKRNDVPPAWVIAANPCQTTAIYILLQAGCVRT